MFAVAIASAVAYHKHKTQRMRTPFRLQMLANAPAVGTPPRLEREFKFGVVIHDNRYLLDDGVKQLQQEIYDTLQRKLVSPLWKVPKLSGSPYFIRSNPMVFVARDIAMDTEDGLAFKQSVVYRFRHRFKSTKQLHRHETQPMNPAYFPYRGEIQSKIGRVREGHGFVHSSEARLEFRDASSPFSKSNPPPPAPWYPKDYLASVRSGHFNNFVTWPAKALAQYLLDRGSSGDVYWNVDLVLISTRMRSHLNMKTPYGSGPNPDQAFILSVDRTDVCDGREYMAFLKRAWYDGKGVARPKILSTFLRVESEFERNVSTKLDEVIDSQGGAFEKSLKKAFLDDQKLIKVFIVKRLEALGIATIEVDKFRKYQEAYLRARGTFPQGGDVITPLEKFKADQTIQTNQLGEHK